MANSATKIRQQLTQQQENALMPQFLNSLKAKADIKIFEPGLVGAIPEAIPAASMTPLPMPSNLPSGGRTLVVPAPGYGTPHLITPQPKKT